MANAVGRGTTPTFTWRLRNILYTDIAVLWLTIKQGDVVLNLDLNSSGLTLEDETEVIEQETVHNTLVKVLLSQEETLMFRSDKKAEAQIRVRFGDDTAGKTKVYDLDVERILKDGVI